MADRVNEIRDATPTWAKISKLADDVSREQAAQHAEVERLRNEVSRRDAVLDWLEENSPAALELCPYKIVRSVVALHPKERDDG